MIFKVGITGGMGSGKSTVAKIFEVLEIPVYYADDAAKKIMNEDLLLKKQLQDLFGGETYIDGMLNRKYLASVVFNNEEKLALLNGIVHPATLRNAEQWMQQQKTPYAIKEAALIFESGAQKQLDYIIGVHAPVEDCIRRVMKRDDMTREAVKARMERQMDEAEKMRLCNYVLINNERKLILPQVLKLHEAFMKKVSP